MSTRKIKINTNPVADRYSGTDTRILEFSSPGGGGLISFVIIPDDQLSVHVYRHDMTVTVSAGEAGQPVRSGNLRADQALYRAAKAFVADWESRHTADSPVTCPNCHGEREWFGPPGIATCHFCGQKS